MGGCAAAVVALTGGGPRSRTPDEGIGSGTSTSTSAGASGSTSASASATTGAPGSAESADGSGARSPADPARTLRFGVSYGDALTWMPEAKLTQAMADAKELGVQWLRVDLSWRNIQPDSPTQYLWERFDRVVAAARADGLEVLPTIAYTPEWAGDPSCAATSQACPPADNAKFAEFARLAAQRYAPLGVHTWEIWNEPNIRGFWRTGTGPDPARYTALLTATSQAIRSVDQDAYLVMGGFAAVDTVPSRKSVAPAEFLGRLARDGALKEVDAIGYHPYTYPLLPSTTTAEGTAFQRIDSPKNSLVATLRRYGAPDMPVWLTETGAPTWAKGKAASAQEDQGTTHVTERLQAEIAADTVTAAAAEPSVQAVFWYSYQDGAAEGQDDRQSLFYGLTRYDGTHKPSFTAYKKAIAAYEKQRQ